MEIENLGFLGGSFDPIHWGHLVIAEEAFAQLGLKKILFVLARNQWLKGRELTPVQERWEMLQLALKANPHFELSRTEIDRSGPSFTVDTMQEMREKYPGARLFFILGWDSLVNLSAWHEPQRLIQLCSLVAVPRHGIPSPDLEVLEKILPGLASRVILLEAPIIGISSSQIRERVKQGLSIRYLVPEAVGKYINDQGLYR